MPQLFFRPKYVWFPPVHLKGPMIPDPSGQLAELIVYITSTRVDLYSHQMLLPMYMIMILEPQKVGIYMYQIVAKNCANAILHITEVHTGMMYPTK